MDKRDFFTRIGLTESEEKAVKYYAHMLGHSSTSGLIRDALTDFLVSHEAEVSALERITETLHQVAYGKSSSLDAPENQNPDFRSGYAAGLDSIGKDDWHGWKDAMDEYRDAQDSGWADWKRGYHVARLLNSQNIKSAHSEQKTKA